MVDRSEHQTRIARYQDALAAGGLSGALLLNAVDVYYLSGTRQNGALFVPAGVVHRFEDFGDDFATWVFFYGPQDGERG